MLWLEKETNLKAGAFQNEISNICSHPTLLRIPSLLQRHSHGRGHDPATGEAVTRCRRLWLLHPSPSSASGPIHGAPCSTAGGLSITIKTSTGPACSLLSPIHSPQWKNPAKDWLEIEGIIKKIPHLAGRRHCRKFDLLR
jgi:hypothetical protein